MVHMKRKIKIGDYFMYKEKNGMVIGKIIKTESTIGTGYHGDRLFIYETIAKENLEMTNLGSYDRFSSKSIMYEKCVVGKSIDEIWVRMI